MAEHRRQRRALAEPDFAALKAALMGSPFVSKSTLAGTFQSSRGFGVAFTRDGRAEVERRIPPLAAFLTAAIDSAAEARLSPWWRRTPPPWPNAWYLNLLLVGAGPGVGAHVDATLADAAGVPGATPRVVSVLYLQVPQSAGGELVLARGERLKGVVRPVEGTLLHFRGDLTHQVRGLDSSARPAVRASLVLEQYHFEPDALARLPPFRLDSHAKFELALQAAAERPAPAFDVD